MGHTDSRQSSARTATHVNAFTSVLGTGRGVSDQTSLLATRPDARAYQELEERTQNLSFAAIAADINFVRAHEHSLSRYPVLQELVARLPERALASTHREIRVTVRRTVGAFGIANLVALGVMSQGLSADSVPTTYFNTSSYTYNLMQEYLQASLASEEVAAEKPLRAVALANYQTGVAQALGLRLAKHPTILLRDALGERTWGRTDHSWPAAELRYKAAIICKRFHDLDLARVFMLSVIKEACDVGAFAAPEHIHEIIWETLEAAMKTPSRRRSRTVLTPAAVSS